MIEEITQICSVFSKLKYELVIPEVGTDTFQTLELVSFVQRINSNNEQGSTIHLLRYSRIYCILILMYDRNLFFSFFMKNRIF